MRRLRPNKAKADALCGSIVRSRGLCEIDDDKSEALHVGKLILQWGHIISRNYHQIRWRLDNAWCICSKHHAYYTNHPLEWEAYVIKKLGLEKFTQLKKEALDYKKLDYSEIMSYLHKAKEENRLWG